MKQLIEELERIEKESRAKLDYCISNYLREKDFSKMNRYVDLMPIFNTRYEDIKAINELIKTALNRIKLTLEYKKSEKDKGYNHYMSSFSLKTNGDYYFAGLFEGELKAYKEIIESLFGGDKDESNKE